MEHKVTAEHSGRRCICGVHIPAHQTGKHPCEPSREQISEYLTREVLGLAYQDWVAYDIHGNNLADHFTPQGIFTLTEAGREFDWWEEFEKRYLLYNCHGETMIYWDYFKPDEFPVCLYQFLKGREPKECLPCKEKVCTNPEHEGYAT